MGGACSRNGGKEESVEAVGGKVRGIEATRKIKMQVNE
jgi:hypothetical protein